jgi:parallel beta-helix repeat protein
MPNYLDTSSCSTQFQDAWTLWHNQNSKFGFYRTKVGITAGVNISFGISPSSFPDPSNDGGITVHAVEDNNGTEDFCYYASSPALGDYYYTEIVFNNCSQFYNSWKWSNSLSNLDYNAICFKEIALHELGHVIGLGHSSDSNSVMYWVTHAGANFLPLQSTDISGLSVLAQDQLTPVVDGNISFYSSSSSLSAGMNYISEVTSISLPSGYTIPSSTVNWKIVLYNTGGNYTWMSGSSSTAQAWSVILPNVPRGNGWQIDQQTGKVLGVVLVSALDNHGGIVTGGINIEVSGVSGNTSSGSLTANETWYGAITLTGDVTVPSGITLTILENSKIYFPNSNSLFVNGTLSAQGVTFSPTSSNTWGSICFSGSTASGSLLNNDVIQNGTKVQFLNSANATIQNSTISNCTQGIYVYNASPTVAKNQILYPTNEGIYIDGSGSTPIIDSNLVKKTAGL